MYRQEMRNNAATCSCSSLTWWFASYVWEFRCSRLEPHVLNAKLQIFSVSEMFGEFVINLCHKFAILHLHELKQL